MIGFGARKLFDDDDGPKYLNTPETPLYKKSHVLYGIDQAKREIAKQGRAVIVEGYTDVMACHLAGVPTAVATCGTAFGADHIGVLRRLLHGHRRATAARSSSPSTATRPGRRRRCARSRTTSGSSRRPSSRSARTTWTRASCAWPRATPRCATWSPAGEPLLDFALRSRSATLRPRHRRGPGRRRCGATAPLVAKIKDRALRPEYARKLAGDLGMEVEPVQRAVAAAGQGRRPAPRPPPPQPAACRRRTARRPLVEREALKLALQEPVLAGPMFDAVEAEVYAPPGARGGPHGDRRGRRRASADRRARSGSSAVRDALRRPGGRGAGRRAGGGAAAAATASRTRAMCEVTLARLQLAAVDRPDRRPEVEAAADQPGHQRGRVPARSSASWSRWSSTPARCASGRGGW